MELEGRILDGRYRLGSLLGVGGMARVYLATDRVLERQVAVKVLSPPYAQDPSFVERFRREAGPRPGSAIPTSWPCSTAAPMPSCTIW
jgi:eukaryotic-like serine/threonine-protein kinase